MDFAVGLGASPTDVSPTDFLVRGFEALFPHAGALGCVVRLAPQLFLLVYLHSNVGPPDTPPRGSPATSLPVLSAMVTCLCPSCQS